MPSLREYVRIGSKVVVVINDNACEEHRRRGLLFLSDAGGDYDSFASINCTVLHIREEL